MSSLFGCSHIVRTQESIYPKLKGIKNASIVSTCTFVTLKKTLKVYNCQKLNNYQFFHTHFVFFSFITIPTAKILKNVFALQISSMDETSTLYISEE